MKLLARFPFKTGVIIGILSFLIVEKPPGGPLKIAWPEAKDLRNYRTEFYPLSAFPMYANFSDEPIYIYLTDEKDKPIALNDLTKAGSSAVKKDYMGLLKKVRKENSTKGDIADSALALKQEAGKHTLASLLKTRSPQWSAKHPDKVIRLYEGVIRRGPDKVGVVTSSTLIAQGSATSLAAP